MGKDLQKISEILIKIGYRLNKEPDFMGELEAFVENRHKKKFGEANHPSIDEIDLFELTTHQSIEQIDDFLSTLSLLELKALLKKYRFGGSSRLKTSKSIRDYILHQLRLRKTDVFQTVTDSTK